MDQYWDTLATEDAYHGVMTEKYGWDKEEYYRTGKEHVEQLVMPFVQKTGVDTSQSSILDIGCGTGRMDRFLAEHFQKVIGTDVSAEMIEKAKEDHVGTSIDFLVTSGKDLHEVQSDSMDVVFSYATLQHVSRKSWVCNHFRDVFRILKKDGVAKMEVRGAPGNPPGRVVWFRGLERCYITLVFWRGFLPLPFLRFYNPLYGACFKKTELTSILKKAGFASVETSLEGGRHLWAEVRK